jgi:hypothetical protein
VDENLRKTIARLSKRARKSPSPRDERDFFYICEECGQAVDKRSVAQIFHHEEQNHLPLTEAELTQLTLVEMAWTKPGGQARRN